jgi:protein-disulfide isomerase
MQKPALAALALMAAGVLMPVATLAETAAPAATTEAPAAPATDAATPAATEVKDFAIGAEDAKVKIVEYASFTCPHCARFHADNWAKLKADYIDTGKVRFEYHEVYFDRYGLWAAMTARCGGELRYFGIADMLFDKQQEWAASDNPAEVVENLKKLGRSAGMDDATLDACLKDGAQAEALVAHFEKNFKADGVEGTPTFFVNGTKHSNMGWDEFKAVIDAELAK